MQKKLELLKLKNLYTGEIVCTIDFDNLVVRDGQSFITVFKLKINKPINLFADELTFSCNYR
jgi:hypothetical protein